MTMPIDADFAKKRKVVGELAGHKIWAPPEGLNPPVNLGIHGTNCAIDWDICTGCGTCISICPMSVYDFFDTPGHPVSPKKAGPINEPACIICMACEIQCPVQAIKITPP